MSKIKNIKSCIRRALAKFSNLASSIAGANQSLTHSVSQNFSNENALIRLLVIANADIPTVQLSLVEPLRPLVSDGSVSIEFLTEAQIRNRFGKNIRSPKAAEWFKKRLADSRATCLYVCRYSGPFFNEIINFSKKYNVRSVYCIDDDLLNVPIEIGSEKFKYHNDPLRLHAVRFLLQHVDVVYCSNSFLEKRLLELDIRGMIYVGRLFCAGRIVAQPLRREACTVGYMGFDHAHDFLVALPAVVNLLRRNKKIRFELFGRIAKPPELEEFGDRVVEIPVVSGYHEFIKALAARRWDIGICPLARTSFNEVKNINKWIEYTSVGAAVVATSGMIYDSCCDDGCGWLADDICWDDALQTLVSDTQLRVRLVEKAQLKLERDFSFNVLRRQVLELVQPN